MDLKILRIKNKRKYLIRKREFKLNRSRKNTYKKTFDGKRLIK